MSFNQNNDGTPHWWTTSTLFHARLAEQHSRLVEQQSGVTNNTNLSDDEPMLEDLNPLYSDPLGPDAPEEALAPDAHVDDAIAPDVAAREALDQGFEEMLLLAQGTLLQQELRDGDVWASNDGGDNKPDEQAQQLRDLPEDKVLKDMLVYTEAFFIASEPEALEKDAAWDDASACPSWHGASQNEPPAAEEVADPPPPGENTEGTQLAMALVATQPEVAVLRGVGPAEVAQALVPMRPPAPTKPPPPPPMEVAQVPKTKRAPQRKHECGECSNTCASASALARHVLVHLPCTCTTRVGGGRVLEGVWGQDGACKKHPFPCTTCGKRFSQATNLQSHIDSVHLLLKYLSPKP
jgi:hypothetical protein